MIYKYQSNFADDLIAMFNYKILKYANSIFYSSNKLYNYEVNSNGLSLKYISRV